MNLFDQYHFLALMSHLVYIHAHINYLLFSTYFLLNISLTIYVRIHNLTATLKIRIDIDRIDSNSNFAQVDAKVVQTTQIFVSIDYFTKEIFLITLQVDAISVNPQNVPQSLFYVLTENTQYKK